MSLYQRYCPDYGFSFDVLELRLICPSDRVNDFVLAQRHHMKFGYRRPILEKKAGITQGTQCHRGDMS
jgi:hypothetical protein